ncbi:MAG: peroxiredoxin-like family protein [Pseudomonadota bacterium]
MRYPNLLILLALMAAPATAEIFPDARDVQPPLPGMAAPAFTVSNVEGERVEFDPEAMERPVILTFYRGGWCPYCNLHLAELRNTEDDLRELGFDVWFVSPDRPELLAEGDHARYGYRLLSDAEAHASQAFGIAFRVDDETHADYLEHGIDLEDRSARQHRSLPAPATFVIGSDGILQFTYVNPDYKVRLAPEVLLAAARAYAEGAQDRLERRRGN